MESFGARREDFGKLCIAQRDNALKFPLALFKEPLTLQAYLEGAPRRRAIASVRLRDALRRRRSISGHATTRRRATSVCASAPVLGTMERHNAFPDDPIQTRGGWVLDRDELFAQAGVNHAAIDFVQTYDDYPVISLMQFEDLGFCAKGEGPEFIRSNTFTADGSFPHNTSGGQLSVGQAGAAGGFLGMTEAIRQLTGAPLGASAQKHASAS